MQKVLPDKAILRGQQKRTVECMSA